MKCEYETPTQTIHDFPDDGSFPAAGAERISHKASKVDEEPEHHIGNS